jgi:histidine ammonia-lyase
MGMAAALKLMRAAQNTRTVVAIEALAAARALDLLAPLHTSDVLEEAKRRIREVCPPMQQDRILSPDIAAIARLIESGALRPDRLKPAN